MFKIQFRKKKLQSNMPYANQFQDPYSYSDDTDPYHGYDREPLDNQEFVTCLFCDGLITGSHLAITTKTGEHCMHPSCLVSGFTLIVNGFGMLVNFLFRKNKK
ncbi:MAG TPA: hypothetical protein ACFYEK_08405 [Candidatus Wunengus sp. YC60]|uniref:hypothetical protein n=1 Tax=Candidatus Wunengus sp. YC60 TaxID=3367697 RepID=UPI004029A861